MGIRMRRRDRHVLPSSADEVPKTHQKAEIPKLPPILTTEVVQVGMGGLEAWGRAEVDSPSREKESRRNK